MSHTAPIDLAHADSVVAALTAGAAANRSAPCRKGSIDAIDAPGRLIATGDLHDNPVNFEKLKRAAGMAGGRDEAEPSVSSSLRLCVSPSLSHLTLHEIIHTDRLTNAMDFSYRMLVHVARLKAAFPDHVHTLLGNHELAQLVDAVIIKDGVKSVEAFSDGVTYVFASEAQRVDAAIKDFIRSMPIALEIHTPRGTILCAHSLPPASAMNRFDTTILKRDLTDDDYQPKTGSAHLMTWGRGYDEGGLEDLTERWGVYLFLLGHEKADDGVKFVPPNALVLASDHERGVYLPVDLSNPPQPHQAMRQVVRLASVE